MEAALTETANEKVLFFKNSRLLQAALVVLILLLGVAIRVVDLSDPPLDFAATRQLRSLIIARGYYYAMDLPSTQALPADQREFGIRAGNAEALIEPTVMEHLAAYTYALAGFEDFRIPRVYAILFWVIGGIPLFLLTRKLLGVTGALAALAFYEFVPYGIIAGRSFQPDPLMVCLIAWAWYFQYRWSDDDTLLNAILAGVFTGLAIYVKTMAIYFVAIPFAALVILGGLLKALRNWRFYLMLGLSILPGAVFIFWNATAGGNTGALFGSRFFPSLFIQPHWYQSWFMTAKSIVGYFPLFLAFIALFMIPGRKARIWYACLWVGYVLLGFTFAYHISSHDYYSLPLVPIVAIGFGLVFNLLVEKIAELKPNLLARVLLIAIFAAAAALSMLKARTDLLAADYRYEEVYWKNLGDKIGHASKVVALTHDYGYRLNYWGFIQATLWSTSGDIAVSELSGATQDPFMQQFQEKTQGYNYFLVTLINDFNSQNELHDYLYANYPYEEGEGYVLFNLQKPLAK